MDSRLRTMLVAVGAVTLGGLGFALFTPQPAARTMSELRDAGIGDGQKLVLECPERLTPNTRRRINRNQPGLLRPRQQYATVARVAVCFGRTLPDGGTGLCFRPDGGVAPLLADNEGEIIIPSLRRDMVGVDNDGGVDDAGEDTEVDDSLQYQLAGCVQRVCGEVTDSPFAAACGALNRLWLVQQPCMVPDCWTLPDGGWDDSAVVACQWSGPYGQQDGGPRWRGCNTGPREWASGPACLPSSCGVVAGDNPWDGL